MKGSSSYFEEACWNLPRFALRGEIVLAFAHYEQAFYNFRKQLRELTHPGWSEEEKLFHLEALQRAIDLQRISEGFDTEKECDEKRAELRKWWREELLRMAEEARDSGEVYESFEAYSAAHPKAAEKLRETQKWLPGAQRFEHSEDLPAPTPEEVRTSRADGARWLASQVDLLTSGSWWEPEKWHPLAQSVAYRLIKEHSDLSGLLLFGIGYFHKEAYFESVEYLASRLEEDFPGE